MRCNLRKTAYTSDNVDRLKDFGVAFPKSRRSDAEVRGSGKTAKDREKMVTQIYTAPLKAYVPNSLGLNGPQPVRRKPQEGSTSATGDEEKQGESSTLAALKEQSQKGTISIEAVITDFQSTMDALGVPDEIRLEVAPYLQVVVHQSQKPQPAIPVIKSNLKAASETLDQFITGALGQNSNVVREWVDALLLQPIDYHTEAPIPLNFPKAQAGLFNTGTGNPLQAGTPGKSSTGGAAGAIDGQAIKQQLQQAKEALKTQDSETAMGIYQKILVQLQGNGHPELEGRVLYQMGKVMDKSGKPEEARSYLQKADELLSGTYQPRIHAKVHRALGSLFNNSGDLTSAVDHYRKAVMMDETNKEPGTQSLSLNQLGVLHTRMGQHDEAKTALEQALVQAKDNNPKILGDILSNLGAVSHKEGKLSQAFSYYKQSLHEARTQNDRAGMRQTLQNMAGIYLEAGKPEKAFKALQNALYRV
jgi:tetratricopeptide (TPR) repeat protein